MAEQSNELLIDHHETYPIGSALFPKVNATTFDLYFHDRYIDYGHGYKGNFKDTFCHQKWHSNVKKWENKNVKILENKMIVYIIISMVNAIWVILVVHQSILKNNEKNIETHFAYEDGDFDYGQMDATHLDIVIFFAQPNGSIDHLIGDESVKKMRFSHIDIYIYMNNECWHWH